MMLRRFYITENTNGTYRASWLASSLADFGLDDTAPVPRSKANRVLKTEILPVTGAVDSANENI